MARTPAYAIRSFAIDGSRCCVMMIAIVTSALPGRFLSAGRDFEPPAARTLGRAGSGSPGALINVFVEMFSVERGDLRGASAT